MVTLIFEGPDNTGKSTIINKFISNFKTTRDICLMHSTGPHDLNGEDPFEFQTKSFREKAMKLLMINSTEHQLPTSPKNIVIMDRSWYGEYVYGQIYRNADPAKLINMIDDCNIMISNTKYVIIQLVASPEFIISHDDGLSFSSNLDKDERYNKVCRELTLFDKCFDVMHVRAHALHLKVNVEGDNLQFRNADIIYNEIFDNLTKHGIIKL